MVTEKRDDCRGRMIWRNAIVQDYGFPWDDLPLPLRALLDANCPPAWNKRGQGSSVCSCRHEKCDCEYVSRPHRCTENGWRPMYVTKRALYVRMTTSGYRTLSQYNIKFDPFSSLAAGDIASCSSHGICLTRSAFRGNSRVGNLASLRAAVNGPSVHPVPWDEVRQGLAQL